MLSNQLKETQKAAIIQKIHAMTQAMVAGDERAFEWIYDRYKHSIYSVILQMVKNEETAADLVQEAFTNAWRYRSNFDVSKATLFTWLKNIGYYRACQYLRLQKPSQYVPLEVEGADYLVIDRSHSSCQPWFEIVDLVPLLAGLTPEHRQLIDLIYFEGYSCYQASQRLNLTKKRGSVEHRAAIKQLQKAINCAEYDPV